MKTRATLGKMSVLTQAGLPGALREPATGGGPTDPCVKFTAQALPCKVS